MRVDRRSGAWQRPPMFGRLLGILWFGATALGATTLSLVTVFEPVTLHGTDVDDVDEAGAEDGAGVQATVIGRSMVLSGAFPEVLVEAIAMPHQLPSNDPGYDVDEANLLVLCQIGIAAEMVEGELRVELDVAKLDVPAKLGLTAEQAVKLAVVAIRKTLETYQKVQPQRLEVNIAITGAEPPREELVKLACRFGIEGG